MKDIRCGGLSSLQSLCLGCMCLLWGNIHVDRSVDVGRRFTSLLWGMQIEDICRVDVLDLKGNHKSLRHKLNNSSKIHKLTEK